jgi:hypothetical protein
MKSWTGRLKRYTILILLLWLAFFLRVWRLPQTPPGLWYDEAYYAMDATWLLEGGPWRLFFAGNNGREPIFIYLQTLWVAILGATPLAARLNAPLAGTLTIPLIYILARRLTRDLGEMARHLWMARWLPYLATAGLAASFWHIGLSRGGYRGILLPLAASLLFYLFWRAWQERSMKFTLLAGLTLGVSQYTYLAARTLPLVFGLFAVAWSLLYWRARTPQTGGKPRLALLFSGENSPLALWLTVGGMALISALAFAPLAWIFYNEPGLFSARTGDVLFSPDSPAELLAQLSQALRLFIDQGDPNWRHHLPGRPMLGWLGWLGFWPGLLICLRRFRCAPYLFLVTALLALYLPALIAVPPVHALRLSALLPIYYIIFALGLIELAGWVARRRAARGQISRLPAASRPALAAIIIVMLIETTLTMVDYFGRWAGAEETYVEYNTPLAEFIEYLVELSAESPVIIPFQIYVHPTARYLLHDRFSEQPAPDGLAGPARLVTLPDNFRMLNVANIPELPAYAWLARRPDGPGVVYISRPPRQAEQQYLRQAALLTAPDIYRDRFGRELAYFRTLTETGSLEPMFTATEPGRASRVTWADLARLDGYEVTPDLVAPNRPITLNLYWRSLTELTFDHRLFLQIVDSAGAPINQWEGEAFREDMYRWRPEAILPTQHTLWLGPETPPGPYLIRLGFFDRRTGERLPLRVGKWVEGRWTDEYLAGEAPAVDQVHLGLFYVSPDGRDPRQPATPLSANFANTIKLIGVTLPESSITSFACKCAFSGTPQLPMRSLERPNLPVTFHWQALQPTDKPYTVFLQLLNQNNEVVSGWDSQPLNGLYPTNLWSPGEIIADTFRLPLPDSGLPPGAYRLITGFYDFETGRRLPLLEGDDSAELSRFMVK